MLLDTGPLQALLMVWLSPVLLTTSLNMKRRDTDTVHKDWKQLWQTNVDESLKSEGGMWHPSDNNTVNNITVQLGATAYLHCRVRLSTDRSLAAPEHVSWVRRRDWHILSAGMLTYTNDERFQILHSEGSDDWTLQIKYVQKRDDGTYECQVSTAAGLVSRFINLQIVVPEAFIQGSTERHVDIGSVINLACIIEKSPTPPQYVFWFHNSRMINYDMARGGISVETLPGPQTQSLLTIRDAHDADSGNYTCTASNTEPASIYVYVQEGDKMASLRRKNSCPISLASEISFILMTLFILFLR